MSQLLNTGTVPQVEKAVKECNSRHQLRLALRDELSKPKNKQRKGVISAIEEKLKA